MDNDNTNNTNDNDNNNTTAPTAAVAAAIAANAVAAYKKSLASEAAAKAAAAKEKNNASKEALESALEKGDAKIPRSVRALWGAFGKVLDTKSFIGFSVKTTHTCVVFSWTPRCGESLMDSIQEAEAAGLLSLTGHEYHLFKGVISKHKKGGSLRLTRKGHMVMTLKNAHDAF